MPKGTKKSGKKSGGSSKKLQKDIEKELKEVKKLRKTLEKRAKAKPKKPARKAAEKPAKKAGKSKSRAVVPRKKAMPASTILKHGMVAGGSWGTNTLQGQRARETATQLLTRGAMAGPIDTSALAAGGGIILGDDVAGPAVIDWMRAVHPATRHLYPELNEAGRSTIYDDMRETDIFNPNYRNK